MIAMFKRLFSNPATCRKFIVALLGAIAIAVSQGVLPAAVATWVTIIGPFLTAFGVYGVYNKEDEPG